MKNCIYGNHGPKRTWCCHEEVCGNSKSKSVANSRCESCPLFEAANGRKRQRSPSQSTCTHRSDEPVREVECQAGCQKGKLLPIYTCNLHGECCKMPGVFERVKETLKLVGDTNTCLKSCTSCTDRS